MLKNTILSLIRFMMSPKDGLGGGVGGTDEEYPDPEDEEIGTGDVDDDDQDEDPEGGKDTDPESGDGEGDEGSGKKEEAKDGKKPEDNPEKKEQDRDFNARQKALRLQREAEERARREAAAKAAEEQRLAKARDEGLIEALGGVNPYTGEKIADETDLKTYRIMKAIKDRGGDPIQDFAKEYAKLEREAAASSKAEAKKAEDRQKAMQEEVEKFKQDYPKEDLGALLSDEGFRKFATEKNLIERVGLITTYELYQDHREAEAAKAAGRKERSDKRRESSPGPLGGGGGSAPSDIYSEEELAKLTPEEAEENLEKALRSQQYYARKRLSKRR